jgi:hypothetical protein
MAILRKAQIRPPGNLAALPKAGGDIIERKQHDRAQLTASLESEQRIV